MVKCAFTKESGENVKYRNPFDHDIKQNAYKRVTLKSVLTLKKIDHKFIIDVLLLASGLLVYIMK